MTNKTREEYFKRYFSQVDETFGIQMWDFIEKSITQSENRILRKWKKEMKILIENIWSNPEHYQSTYTPKEVVEFFINKNFKAKKEVKG